LYKEDNPHYALVTFTASDTIIGKLTPHWKRLTEEEFNALIEKQKL